jgi:hypothetical protein
MSMSQSQTSKKIHKSNLNVEMWLKSYLFFKDFMKLKLDGVKHSYLVLFLLMWVLKFSIVEVFLLK